MADALLDAVLDAARRIEPSNQNSSNHPQNQRVAVEILAKDYLIVLSGEMRIGADVRSEIDIDSIIRRKWESLGYPGSASLTVINHIQPQQPELVASSDRRGAGDQGIMIGYATLETPSLMPKEYVLARDICQKITELRVSNELPWLRPDGKAQVTLTADGKVSKVVVGAQHALAVDGRHDPRMIQEHIREQLKKLVIYPICQTEIPDSHIVVNGSGSFAIGGTLGDAGVVGRKIVVDAYGPRIPVGGGAYSGKDPTKVDRSAAYMARYIASTGLREGIADARELTISLAYAIGQYQPEMVTAITDSGRDVSDWVHQRFPDLSPKSIAERFDLWRNSPAIDWCYQDAAAFGHYGRSEFPWN